MGIRHPFSGALYERDGEGTADGDTRILVTDRDGRWGRFDSVGRWIDGELRECDPQLCGWVAGPQVANHRMADASADD